jgi:hypothetical protein
MYFTKFLSIFSLAGAAIATTGRLLCPIARSQLAG